MKRLLSVLLVAVFFILANSFRSGINNTGADKSKVEVIFNHTLQANDLVKIKTYLAKKGIEIQYKSTEFDDSGYLKYINFSVDCKDGFVGGGSEDNLTNQSCFGFCRDYSKHTKSPFTTGNLDFQK